MIDRLTSCILFQTSFLRVSRLSLLALVAVTLAVVPFRLAAQQSEPATAATPAASAGTAAPETHQSQEDQEKVFLLGGPIVKWTARTFNISVETAAGVYQIINFLAIVLLIGIPLGRVLPRIFRKRSQTLGHSLKSAREATEDANARLRAVEAKLAGLDDEIKKLQTQVEQESLEDEARVKASLAEESARIVESAEQELSAATAHARRGLRNFAADLAIEQAARQLDLTPETDRALITEFIGDVSANGTNHEGGQK